jgi:hypothetical protein
MRETTLFQYFYALGDMHGLQTGMRESAYPYSYQSGILLKGNGGQKLAERETISLKYLDALGNANGLQAGAKESVPFYDSEPRTGLKGYNGKKPAP